MAITVEKKVAGVTFNVRKMTIREIYGLFEKAINPPDEKEPSANKGVDWVGNTLFEDATIQDILTFTDLTRDQVLDMAPSAAQSIIDAIKCENPHFFAACRRLEEAGKRLDAVLETTTSSASKPASLP